MPKIHNIGESNERRGLECTYCGKRILPTRRQRRSKTARRICVNCGHSNWEPCKTSIVHVENKIAEEVMSIARMDDSGRKIL